MANQTIKLYSSGVNAYQWRFTTLSLMSLLAGLMIYLYARESNANWLLVHFPAQPSITIPWHHQLPSLLHAFSFFLLSIAVLGLSLKIIVFNLSFWLSFELLFEFGQHHVMADWLYQHGITLRYWHGTFDQGDILASIIGCLLATVLSLLAWRGEQDATMAKNDRLSHHC